MIRSVNINEESVLAAIRQGEIGGESPPALVASVPSESSIVSRLCKKNLDFIPPE